MSRFAFHWPTIAKWALRGFIVLCIALVIFTLWLDLRVRGAFDTNQWQQPAKVYAKPLILARGVAITPAEFETQLRLLGYRRDPALTLPGSWSKDRDRYFLHLRAFPFPDERRKAREIRVEFNRGSVQRLADGDNKPVREELLDPILIGNVFPKVGQDRLYLPLDKAPKTLPQILMAVEDQDFYQHRGISIKGITRAFLANLRAGKTVQGGSTLTQQLVKNRLLTRERSLWRKFQEVLMALLTELHYSKSEILEAYINEVYLGQDGGRAVHGFALASWHYFNRPLEELGTPELALLVGMVKGPSLYHPKRNPNNATARRNVVLDLLANEGIVRKEQVGALKATPITLSESVRDSGRFPAYLDLVRRQLQRDYKQSDLQSAGLRIFTPFDPQVQRRAESAMEHAFKQLGDKYNEVEAAMVVTDAGNSDIVAILGGKQASYAGFNRALDSERPIGSLAKPAVMLTALRRPRDYTLATVLLDEPVIYENQDGSFWEPENYDEESHGPVILLEALSQSYNQATARLGLELGVNDVIDTFKRLGVQRDILAVPSIFLGAVALSPVEVAAMYQSIASDGVNSSLRAIYAVTDSDGKLLAQYPQKQRQLISPEHMSLLQFALVDVMRNGTGRGAQRDIPLSFTTAGKSGSSNELRDSWFAGFAGDYLAVVWMGRDDYQPAGLTGSRGALRAWSKFMATTSREPLSLDNRPEVVKVWVNRVNGLLTDNNCENAISAPFIAGSEPTQWSACYGAAAENPTPRPRSQPSPVRRIFDIFGF